MLKKIDSNEMKMNDYEMSMRWSNHARSIPEISVKRKPRRVQTMEKMKKMSLELFLENESKT